jgi:hypothetical protein
MNLLRRCFYFSSLSDNKNGFYLSSLEYYVRRRLIMAAKQTLHCGTLLTVLTALLCLSNFFGCGAGMEPEVSGELARGMESEASGEPAGGMEPEVSGEPAVIEEDTEDMIVLFRWRPASATNKLIIVKHPNNNAVFECQADNGLLFPMPIRGSERYDDNEKKVRTKPGGRFSWGTASYSEEGHDFVEIILKLGKNIIGYAVVDIIQRYENIGEFQWDALVLKSVLFPQAGGKYQNVSEEYVKTAIEKVKSEHPVEKGGEDMVKLLPSWSSIPQKGAFTVDYSDIDAVFECGVDNGQFGFAQDSPKTLFVMPGATVYWQPDPGGETKEAFIEIILRSNDNITGYALIGIEQYRGRNPTDYGAAVIRTVLFPQTGGEYQKINEEYVYAVFKKVKSMWRKSEELEWS